ncbi:MAG TPA: 50S ribosomal protein L22 [Patescibacteria group bacterium]|jgi:large subunit ribosomal protein L22
MQVTAKARFQRGSATKARLLLEPLRGARAEDALHRLRLQPHAAARPVAKLIASAVANAEHNYSLDKSSLVIDALTADQGPSYRRYRPAAKGRANPIKRPSMHLVVTLKDIPAAGAKPAAGKPKKRAKQQVKKVSAKTAPKQESKAAAGVESAKPKDQSPKQDTGASERKPSAPRKTDRQTGVNAKADKGKGA